VAYFLPIRKEKVAILHAYMDQFYLGRLCKSFALILYLSESGNLFNLLIRLNGSYLVNYHWWINIYPTWTGSYTSSYIERVQTFQWSCSMPESN
jgi:hypothetical protein